MNPKERLIVALDIDSEEKALGLVDTLKGEAKIFKVGSELFTSSGPAIVKKIKDRGGEIFLDLKFHDIPNTVANAVTAATRLRPFIFNVHTLGGYEMMKRASDAARKEAERLKIPKPKLIGVTILTSMDEFGLKKIGISDNIESQVLRLAAMAKDAGLDGVVASAREARYIREALGKDFLIVTPGVRPEWAAEEDQKRVATPKEAIANGADYIVIGRPITGSRDPREAARKILAEL